MRAADPDVGYHHKLRLDDHVYGEEFLDLESELARLRQEVDGTAEKVSWLAIEVTCNSDAQIVLERVRELLICALERCLRERPELDPDREPQFEDIDFESWRRCLPKWFIASCPPEIPDDVYQLMSREEKRQASAGCWPFRNWVFHFACGGCDERHWRWWDAQLLSASSIRVRVQNWNVPALGELSAAFYSAGAVHFGLEGDYLDDDIVPH